MIRFLLPCAAAVATFLVGWIMGGFLAWNWDVSTWAPLGRAMLLWCSSPFAFGAFLATRIELS